MEPGYVAASDSGTALKADSGLSSLAQEEHHPLRSTESWRGGDSPVGRELAVRCTWGKVLRTLPSLAGRWHFLFLTEVLYHFTESSQAFQMQRVWGSSLSRAEFEGWCPG